MRRALRWCRSAGVERCQALVHVLDFLKGHQVGQRDHALFGKRRDEGAAQTGDMAVAAELAAEIAGQRPHIGALAALDFEMRGVGIRAAKQRQAEDLDLARGISTVSPSRARS
jgi:hypothetical protein